MTLTDAGPLVAMLNRDDQHHAICLASLGSVVLPFLTTEACITEALHFLGKRYGWSGQDLLLEMVESGRILVEELAERQRARVRQLMRQYRDRPMDYADATLVATAEDRGMNRVFTLDSGFRFYRIGGRHAFHVVP